MNSLNDRQQTTDTPDHEVKSENANIEVTKSDNIDLFAAGPRRLPVKPLQQVAPPTPPSSSDTDNRRSVQDMATSPGARNGKIELRAELLRLEAEREQFEVDKQRIDQEKVISQHFSKYD